MTASPVADLLDHLAHRFAKHMHRHAALDWPTVQTRLLANPAKCGVLAEMERTGGEPDVTGVDDATGEIIFCDCAPESPPGRRSLCYDRTALDARKENRPVGNACDLAATIGISLLTEPQYRKLQELGEYDRKTSSWIATPQDIRHLGGALFCDRRYGQVFTYHNGADSYYAARGFRGWLKV